MPYYNANSTWLDWLFDGEVCGKIKIMEEQIMGKTKPTYTQATNTMGEIKPAYTQATNTMCDCSSPLRSYSTVAVDRVVTHNDRVTIVHFTDGSFTKAVCSSNDNYDIDVGITVCLIKKMLGGSKQYNDLIRSVHKRMDTLEKEKKKAAEAKKLQREKEQRNHEKKEHKQKEYIEQYKNDISDAVVAALQAYDKLVGDDGK